MILHAVIVDVLLTNCNTSRVFYFNVNVLVLHHVTMVVYCHTQLQSYHEKLSQGCETYHSETLSGIHY